MTTWLVLSLLLLAAACSQCSSQQCSGVADKARVDCWPEITGSNQQLCELRGCCWNPSARNDDAMPFCFYPLDYQRYRLVGGSSKGSGQSLTFSKSAPAPWPRDFLKVVMQVAAYSSKVLRVTISDSEDTKRWRVPIPLAPPQPATDNDFVVTLPQQQNASFFVKINRRSDGRSLFDTSATTGPLIFSDQFIQLSAGISADVTYGIGEHFGPFAKTLDQWRRLVLWNRDSPPEFQTNLYGAHNFLLCVTSGGGAFGIFLLNSNAQEVFFNPRLGASTTVTYRTIGGILDFFIFAGPTPKDVIQQYHNLIGMPMMPPFWSIGFHLCRYGFKTLDEARAVYERNVKIDIPIDVVWSDIDYMDGYKDWTFDPKRFAGLPEFIRQIHAQHRSYVVIVDPGISNTPGYLPYDLGLKMGVFMRAADNKTEIIGSVWPGDVVWPDFTHPSAQEWWYRSAADFLRNTSVDGLWIDMNEPSNFYDGGKYGCSSSNRWDNPPYVPHILGYRLFYAKTVCPSALQHLSNHYDLHNMYSYHEAKATWQLLRTRRDGKTDDGKRQFILTRSSFPGSQQFTFHWTGDNYADWTNLHNSVTTILNFNIYGIVNTGTDVCGFNSATTEELCIRWTQLGAFYPFMRNHNSLGLPDQDPAAFGPRTQAIMRTHIKLRYFLLPYIYTQFYVASTEGTTVARSLMEEFTSDEETWIIDDQFLFGPAVMVCPVVVQGAITREVYFPPDACWYDAVAANKTEVKQKGLRTVPAPLEFIPVYYRGGNVVAQQLPGNDSFHQKLLNPFVLTVALDSQQRADGRLFWDDAGDEDLSAGAFLLLRFSAANGKLTSSTLHSASLQSQMRLFSVEVLGLDRAPSSVLVNGAQQKFYYTDGHLVVGSQGIEGVDLRRPLEVTWA